MGTIISQKETSPLAHFVCNSLPHKSFRFCSPMRNIWNQQLEPANETSNWKPSNRKKKLPFLIAKAINSLPHKSFRFCSPMQNIWSQQLEPANETSKWEPSYRKKKLPLLLTSFAIHCLTKASAFVPQCKTYGVSNWNQQMKPANGNHHIAKRNFPSCSLRSQFTASQKLPLLFPNAPLVTSDWKPTHKTSNWKPLFVCVPSKLRSIALRALPTKPSLLSSLRIIHPLLILQVDCTTLRFVDLLTNLHCR